MNVGEKALVNIGDVPTARRGREMHRAIIFVSLSGLLMAQPVVAGSDHTVPDLAFTPGTAAPDVTPDNIDQTICVPGFTKPPRRPPAGYTNRLKAEALSDPSRDYSDNEMSDYEEDHLIPLELGGDPKDSRNLWPEPYDAGAWGARTKDKLERKLNRLVCAGQVDLRTAQHAIATNWVAAYNLYISMPIADDDSDDDDR
jgi:hypothetical protein